MVASDRVGQHGILWLFATLRGPTRASDTWALLLPKYQELKARDFSRHLSNTPVDTLGHALLQQGLGDVAGGVDDAAHQGGVLVHGVVAVRLQDHLDVPLQEPRLGEEVRLHTEGLAQLGGKNGLTEQTRTILAISRRYWAYFGLFWTI